MAVRSEAIFPAKMVSAAEKNYKGIAATADHVRRILSDHDYLKHPAAEEDVNEKTSIVNDGLQLENVQLQSGFQERYGARSSTERKVFYIIWQMKMFLGACCVRSCCTVIVKTTVVCSLQ